MIYLNNKPISVTIFPDNTSQVWKIDDIEDLFNAEVVWEFSHEGEVLHLAQLKALLDNHCVRTSLTINYLPYGRQDKDVNNNQTFALIPFAHILNSLEFDSISIVDPHSPVALKNIYNSKAIYPVEELKNVFDTTNSTLVCYPDSGATNKYSGLYDYPYIYGEKVRNQLTGSIISYKLVGNCKDQNVLIVDDICDGGATFQMLTKELKDAGAKTVSLFVTHGIFSKGTRILKEAGIDRIFTHKGEVHVRQHSSNV